MMCVAKILILTMAAALGLAGQGPDFASFENEAESVRWTPTGAASITRSTAFPSWQTHSLRLVVPAGASGGVETRHIPRDWRRYEALQFFVYAEQAVTLVVELGDGASQRIRLRRGSNHVQLKTRDFRGTDLRNVERLTLRLEQTATLYVDRFRLTEYNEVLASHGRMDTPYNSQIETPHFKWANPYVSGPIRVLIVPDVAHGRAAIELAQRLECHLFAVTLGARSGTNRWGFGDFYGERGPSYGAPFSLAHTYLADDLLNGPEYDVMVLPGNRPWAEFPEVVRAAIRQRVEAGMGLVLIDTTATEDISPLTANGAEYESGRWLTPTPHYITRNVPLERFPHDQIHYRQAATASGRVIIESASGTPILAVRELGKGRVVAAAWQQRGLIPMVEDQWDTTATWPYWEYMYSLLARSVVWAARKESPAGLREIHVDSNGARIHLSEAAKPGWVVEATTRDEFWTIEQELSHELSAGDRHIQSRRAGQPRGKRHFVDIILKDGAGKVMDWGTATYQTELPAEIAEITFSSDRFSAGATVTGEITIEGTPRAGSELRLRLFDNYDRLLDRATLPANSGGMRFRLSSEGCLTRLARLEAELLVNGEPRNKKHQEVFILQPKKWDHYDVVMYLFGSDPAPGLWNPVQQRLKEMYVTTLSSYPLELSKHANFGIQAQTRISGQESPDGESRKPYLARKNDYHRTKDKKHLARIHCLNDPEYRELQRREIAEKVTPWVPFSPMSYYIYEEPSLTCYDDAMDLCFSRFCMAKMGRWLRIEYGNLGALNRQWGTSFARWEDVIPDTSEEAQKRGNFSCWADHRTFMEITYAENYAYVKQLLRQHDPDGLVLLSGTQSSSPHNGCDYSRLDFIVDHLNPYNHEGQIEFHRSFNPELRLSGGSGYGVHGRRVLYDFYRNLFHGYWAGSYVFWQYSILNPDYRFCQSAKDIRDGYREIVDGGVDSLIRGATRENNGIAIHYSYPSIHGAWIADGRAFPPVGRGTNDLGTNWGPTGAKFRLSRDGWTSALQDLGLQFDYVARQQIEAGALIDRGFKLLVLPFSVALSRREVAEIERFVHAGGSVIADRDAGVMDVHAKWLPEASLDKLFGIRRSTPVRGTELTYLQPAANLELTGSTALAEIDGAPVVIRNQFGQGKALYLNFLPAVYQKDPSQGQADRWKQLLGRALDEVGISSGYKVLRDDGRALEDYELVPYRAGNVRYLGLLKENDAIVQTDPVQIALDRPHFVYDVRTKRSLGRVGVIRDEIRTAEPKLYALLPDPVQSLNISRNAAPQRGQGLTYRVALDAGS
ncbi:MAG: hypothetical protein GY953_48915, partial [bacterium]|nr:hypothetical protein [bacterium]